MIDGAALHSFTALDFVSLPGNAFCCLLLGLLFFTSDQELAFQGAAFPPLK